MASKVIVALLFSLFFISQVSSEFKSNEDTSHVSKPLHEFNRGGDRKLMHTIVLHITKYLKNRVPIGSLALAPAPAPTSAHPFDCGVLCKNRCSLNSRQNMCLRACGTCCARCKCVPPGTSGNREVCGKCYTDMTTHHNQTKCP